MTKILLVDDEPAIVEALELALTEYGLEVRTATNGVGALDAIATWRPDVVLSDWMMPAMDGGALAHALKDVPELAGIQILMMSALHPDGDLPVDGFLHKPFAIPQLLQLIDPQLSGRAASSTRGRSYSDASLNALNAAAVAG